MSVSIVLFNGLNAANQHGLWVTDGTAAGTHELTGISGASSGGLFNWFPGGYNPDFTSFNGEVLFQGKDTSGNLGLWVTDGTAAGTHELTGISGANSGGIFILTGFGDVPPPDFTTFNGELLFRGVDAAGQAGLWVTDGTAAGTHEITGIGGASSGGVSPQSMTVLNIGQLCRERFGNEAALVGFGMHTGTVAAASDWGGDMEVKRVRPSHRDSYERLCHDAGVTRFLLDLRPGQHRALRQRLLQPRLERFIGVIYRPDTELLSHYADASLPQQFDSLVWFNETSAVTPLGPKHARPGLPETYPFGL
jgi:ELWxxDGT repeat protein